MLRVDERAGRIAADAVAHVRAARWAWPVAFGCVLAVEAAVLLWAGRNQWYFFDEWRLIVERVVAPGDVSWFERLFRPDGEHVIAVPLALFVLLVEVSGLDTYWAFVVANVVVRLVTLVLADDIVRVLGGRRSARLVVAVSIALFGGGFEALFGQSVIFAGLTLVFALAAVRAAVAPDASSTRAGAIATVMLTLAVFSSSYGFPAIVAVVVVFVATRRPVAGAVALVVPPVAFLGVRALAGGSYSEQQPVEPGRLALYVDYVQAGLSALGEAMTGLEGLGLASFVGIVVFCVVAGRGPVQLVVTAALTSAIVAFYVQASLSRSVFGAEQAAATRYIFFCGVLGFVMVGVSWGARRVTGRVAVAVGVLVAVSLVSSVGRLAEGYNFFLPKMQLSRSRLTVGFAAVHRGVADIVPDPEWAPDLRDGRLLDVVAWHGSDELVRSGERCFDRTLDALTASGVRTSELGAREQAALVLLVNEHALGYGADAASLQALVEAGAEGSTGSPVVAQFEDEYRRVLADLDAAGDPVVAACAA